MGSQSPQTSSSRIAQVVGDAVPARFAELTWQDRLAHIEDTMREVSKETDPQAMVNAYSKRMRGTIEPGHIIAISRRGLQHPNVRLTRTTMWAHQPDPWKERDKLPIFNRGLLSELVWGDKPRIMPALNIAEDDPAAEYLKHAKSLVAIPHYENGVGLNMVLHTGLRENAFDVEKFPELVLQSNLFGRGTMNLVLARDLREAYEQLDAELRSVQDIQLSLLPQEAPNIPSLEIATHYQTSKRAGGDYYDFFELPDGKWGILVADVSGHGTPAAVMMAIVHAIAHLMPGDTKQMGVAWPPHEAMAFINKSLSKKYTRDSGAFVTMIYGVYDDKTRTLHYANAGHPAPIIRSRDGSVSNHEYPESGFPLGIVEDATYATTTLQLKPGDAMVLYTDGITEAFNERKEMFGERGMFNAIRRGYTSCLPCVECENGEATATIYGASLYGEMPSHDVPGSAAGVLNSIIDDLGKFAGLTSRSDDRTVVVAAVR
ncbi:MAG: PP2C family protein-serine/threonine phosphatase [Phycisphaerales bacterium]